MQSAPVEGDFSGSREVNPFVFMNSACLLMLLTDCSLFISQFNWNTINDRGSSFRIRSMSNSLAQSTRCSCIVLSWVGSILLLSYWALVVGLWCMGCTIRSCYCNCGLKVLSSFHCFCHGTDVNWCAWHVFTGLSRIGRSGRGWYLALIPLAGWLCVYVESESR